jgi:uncharacterized protein
MTPQERELVANLFDRLAQLEGGTRDPEAEKAIAEGMSRAPNAVYALVQTALVQDEALKRADARIRELEGEYGEDSAPAPQGFLDTMRASLFGRRDVQGSVPTVRPAATPMGVPPGFQTGMQPNAPMQEPPPSPGGSFLGTAAAAAAGAIGGAFLLDGIRSMMGHRPGAGAFAASDPASASSPWTGSAAGSDLAREAGLNDIGRPSAPATDSDPSRGFGLFGSDNASGGEPEGEDAGDLSDDFDIGDTGEDV